MDRLSTAIMSDLARFCSCALISWSNYFPSRKYFFAAQGRKATIVVRVGNNRPDLGVNPICNRFTGIMKRAGHSSCPATHPGLVPLSPSTLRVLRVSPGFLIWLFKILKYFWPQRSGRDRYLVIQRDQGRKEITKTQSSGGNLSQGCLSQRNQ